MTAFPTSNHFTQERRHLHAVQRRIEGLTSEERGLMLVHNLAKYDKLRMDQAKDTVNMTRQEFRNTQTSFEVNGKGNRKFFNRQSLDIMIHPSFHPELHDLTRSRYEAEMSNKAYNRALEESQ